MEISYRDKAGRKGKTNHILGEVYKDMEDDSKFLVVLDSQSCTIRTLNIETFEIEDCDFENLDDMDDARAFDAFIKSELILE